MFGAIRFLSCAGGLSGTDGRGTSRQDYGPGGERPCRWSPPSAFRIWMWTRKACSRLEGTRPEGALLEGSRPEESLLERVLLTCWRDPRRGGRSQESPAAVEPIGGCRGAGVGVGRGGSLFRGAGRSRRTVPTVAARAPVPPSPLAAIPRLDGDPSPPHDRSSCLHCKGVPRRRPRRSVCCCRTLVCRGISIPAYLRTERTAAEGAHARERGACPREGQPSPPNGPAPRHRALGPARP
jgi:hypothetical protein